MLSLREINETRIQLVVERIYNQREFIKSLFNSDSKCAQYSFKDKRVKSFNESLSKLFPSSKEYNKQFLNTYNQAMFKLINDSDGNPLIEFFNQYPNFLNFFEEHFHKLESVSAEYQEHELAIINETKRTIESNLIQLLKLCQTKENQVEIQAIIDIINGENIPLTDEIKLVLKTPKVIYAFASLNIDLYLKQVPQILTNEFKGDAAKLRNRYQKLHDKFKTIHDDKKIDPDLVQQPLSTTNEKRSISQTIAYAKLQQEIENNIYNYTEQKQFTSEDIKHIDKKFIMDNVDLLPEYLREHLKLWPRLNAATTNLLETAMLNRSCTKDHAIQHKKAWDNFLNNQNGDAIVSINNLMRNNPRSLFNTPRFKFTMQYALMSNKNLLASITRPISKVNMQIALKEINRRLFENDSSDFENALRGNNNACLIIRENMFNIANRFHEKTRLYHLEHYKEYLATYNDQSPEKLASVQALDEKDIQINNKNIQLLLNGDAENFQMMQLKIIPEITFADNDEYNTLVRKINPAARILAALNEPCNNLKMMNNFDAVIELRNCLKQATSCPGIEELNNPRNPGADTLLIIVKGVAIVLGMIVLSPLIVPLPFLAMTLWANTFFPKQPKGCEVIQSRNDTERQLGLN